MMFNQSAFSCDVSAEAGTLLWDFGIRLLFLLAISWQLSSFIVEGLCLVI
jgi:hypothetical protein